MDDSKTFLALYLVPGSVLAEWAETDPEIKEPAEQKMRAAWRTWMEENAQMLTVTEAAGKTKLVSASGVSDTRNDIHLYSYVKADSHEAAVKIFENHPHLQIPQSSIEVMEVRSMCGM